MQQEELLVNGQCVIFRKFLVMVDKFNTLSLSRNIDMGPNKKSFIFDDVYVQKNQLLNAVNTITRNFVMYMYRLFSVTPKKEYTFDNLSEDFPRMINNVDNMFLALHHAFNSTCSGLTFDILKTKGHFDEFMNHQILCHYLFDMWNEKIKSIIMEIYNGHN